MILLLEEQNELLREHVQLTGELINVVEKRFDSRLESPNSAILLQSKAATTRPNPTLSPCPSPDPIELEKALSGSLQEYDVFWPKAKAPPSWVRVSVKHSDLNSLSTRIAQGCLCGKAIVLRKNNESEFFSCEGITQRGSCNYRPAVQVDNLAFVINLPPCKENG